MKVSIHEGFDFHCIKIRQFAWKFTRVWTLFFFRNGEDRWAASIILLFSDIIDTRFSIITNQVPTCSAFKVAAEEATETPVVAAAIQLNEFFSDMLSGR